MNKLILYIVDCKQGDIGEYILKRKGNKFIPVEGNWPFDKEDIWLEYLEDGSLMFYIYEGCHPELGDRDESSTVPGYLENEDYFVTLSKEEAYRVSEETKVRREQEVYAKIARDIASYANLLEGDEQKTLIRLMTKAVLKKTTQTLTPTGGCSL